MALIHAFIWEYEVRSEQVEAFALAYGPRGEWAEYFSGCPQYLRTRLFQDAQVPTRFITIDYFETREARETFVAAHQAAFDRLDAKWEAATIAERKLGEFQTMRPEARQ